MCKWAQSARRRLIVLRISLWGRADSSQARSGCIIWASRTDASFHARVEGST